MGHPNSWESISKTLNRLIISLFFSNFALDNQVNDYDKNTESQQNFRLQRVSWSDRHPLITVIDFSEISPIRHSLNRYGVYGVFVQEDNDLDLTYGCGRYDYRDGSLICVAPGQIGGKEDNGERRFYLQVQN